VTEHKMRVIDGVRYRPEDAPKRPAENAKPAEPVSTDTAKGRRTKRKEPNDGDSAGTAG
jgi:hypothetical protein